MSNKNNIEYVKYNNLLIELIKEELLEIVDLVYFLYPQQITKEIVYNLSKVQE